MTPYRKFAGQTDILMALLGLLLLIHWSYVCQAVGKNHLLSIPQVKGHPAEPIQAYRQFLAASHTTTSPDQPLFTVTTSTKLVAVTVHMLLKAL